MKLILQLVKNIYALEGERGSSRYFNLIKVYKTMRRAGFRCAEETSGGDCLELNAGIRLVDCNRKRRFSYGRMTRIRDDADIRF